ncbi:polysaccharide deacetylase family protein [Brevibacillus invocatus]|uniref:polysaccharide deacetylase family protein n=1 Tax=Brevibacillus invocatus TaxID=173959 RepID=UPI0020400A41|nr:polysaccharide deacetylase family protein [Brevibacillus invocatus]MCM3080473.1 polysaccharide deacetylase family protein [Brevibacillus invocatus]MCM3430606.1 polysaccharide deacetylase family protein [Brevibacillus invocatus]
MKKGEEKGKSRYSTTEAPIRRKPKEVALTFDDGPDHLWTPRVLDILAQYRVKATFMCVGQMAKYNPKILERIASEGHVIGNHSWDHPYFTKIALSAVLDQVERTTEQIDKIIGLKPRLVRPPYGATNEDVNRILKAGGHEIILWDVDSWDWKGLAGPQVARNVLGHVGPGSVVLQHCAGTVDDTLKGTVEALPYIIEVLCEQKYAFTTISEMFQLEAYW